MLRQVVGPSETFPAHITMVRPLPRVDPQMSGQIALTTEGPSAEQTNERPLPRVLPHVQLQVLLGPDALPAERTGESALPLALRRVRPQEAYDGGLLGAPEGLAAAAGRGQIEGHRVNRVVLLGLRLISVRGRGLSSHLVADVFLFYLYGRRIVFLYCYSFVRTGNLVVAVLDRVFFAGGAAGRFGLVFFGRVFGTLAVEALQGVVQTVLLERFQVSGRNENKCFRCIRWQPPNLFVGRIFD